MNYMHSLNQYPLNSNYSQYPNPSDDEDDFFADASDDETILNPMHSHYLSIFPIAFKKSLFPDLLQPSPIGESSYMPDTSYKPNFGLTYPYQIDPARLRTDQNASYVFKTIQAKSIEIQYLNKIKKTRNNMLNCTDMNNMIIRNFNPYNIEPASQDNGIHNTLNEICDIFWVSFEKKHGRFPKIEECEKFVSEIIFLIVYTDFNGTQEQFEIFAKSPCFELLEIALRNHIFQRLLNEQKDQIEKYFQRNNAFPSDIENRKNYLNDFITKNNFYINYHKEASEGLISSNNLKSKAKEYAEQASKFTSLTQNIESYEELITAKLKKLQLENQDESPSTAASRFKRYFREALTEKMILNQVETFKTEFQTTGLCLPKFILEASDAIHTFSKNKGKFFTNTAITHELLTGIFEIGATAVSPLKAVLLKIDQEEKEKLSKAKGFFSSLFSDENSIRRLAETKRLTITAIETLWTQLFPPSPQPFEMEHTELDIKKLVGQPLVLQQDSPISVIMPLRDLSIPIEENSQPQALSIPIENITHTNPNTGESREEPVIIPVQNTSTSSSEAELAVVSNQSSPLASDNDEDNAMDEEDNSQT